jgi:type IV pilus assembly protein PilY1
MYRLSFFIITVVISAVSCFGTALAGPDQYMGDTAIYSGASTSLRPNVLLIIDNSNTTLEAASGEKYNPNTTYANHGYSPWNIYEAGQQGEFSQTAVTNGTNALENLNCTNNNSIIKNTLLAQGTYVGSGTTNNPNIKNNTCDTAPKGKTYALGNFLNYTKEPAVSGLDTQRKVIYDALNTVVGGARYAVNFGAMVYGANNKGGEIMYPIGNLSADSDYQSFLNVLPGGNPGTAVLSSQTARPQGEAVLDAGYYFRGQGLPVSGQAAMTSPIQNWCGENYIILITNGLSNKDDDPKLATLIGDLDADGMEANPYGLGTHYLDDVAKKLYESDNSDTLDGFQRIVTNTILAFQPSDPLVQRAADASHGRGGYFNARDANELADALSKLLITIVNKADTSFVAPVVPVSPENRTYSGSRVYMGFFKPISKSYWLGNLKKYGINSTNNIIDKDSLIANYVDLNGNGFDDNDTDLALPSGAINGTFKSSATSFWSSAPDGGLVESGGAGAVLLARDFSTNPRNIFTFTGTNVNLTDASNAFSKTNAAITTTTLDVATSTDKDKLVDFIYGIDTFDENGNGNTTEKRNWLLGDVLHSKPLIVNYASYDFSSSNESNCSVNKSMIFVGANDGMLHAFNDCDGTEAWAFIPPDLLANLKYIPGLTHTYFADSSPNVYIYDHDNDGDIETVDGDKVIVIFGQRRGGGKDASPTRGSYYALDVSNPVAPEFLWSIDNTAKTQGTTVTAMTDYVELAETWSEPKLIKMKIGSSDKIVAFVGAGYDNAYEDSRYGATQTFSGSGTVNTVDLGLGVVTSSGTSTTSSKGKGVYAIEIADLNSGAPVFTHSGDKIKGFTHADYGTMNYSFPSELTALDMNNDGYADRLYASDAGGDIWRFDVGDTSVSNWTATRIFKANPGSDVSDTGRKIFYKPSAVVEPGNIAILYFGTGDREHPLNRGVVDRFYALKDKGQSTTMVESDLVDVTLDLLQTTTIASGTGSISDLLAQLNAADKYGWFIKLDQNSGEKVLAPPTIFNKVAYFTTYAPNTLASLDPCKGNLGTARLYAVDYLTGEAVLNYDKSNDTATINNKRANSVPGHVLVRNDRSVTLGSGIPSGIVLIINPNGGLKALIGVGGVIPGQDPKKGGSIIPLYWRQK